MTVTDEQIGRNVHRLRGDRSQADVANAMRKRGWKWSQTTVWKVESGERPLRLTEAVDLAEIFGVYSLATPDHDTILLTAMRDMEIANAELVGATQKFIVSQDEINEILGELSISEGVRAMARSRWTDLDPHFVVTEAVRSLGSNDDAEVIVEFGEADE